MLAAVPAAARCGELLERLLGPPIGRPGELHEAVSIVVPKELATAAGAAGLPVSLAVAVTAERALITRETIGDTATIHETLGRVAGGPPRLALSAAQASYARTLIAALNGQLPRRREDGSVYTAPTRLADRLRAAPDLELEAEALHAALRWEIAAVRCGRTMTEWALHELLATNYPASAARHEPAAASAAR